jgi:hypothetical protein
MSVSEETSDPIIDFDTLTSELASLQRQFSEHKMKQEEFELLSNNIIERITRAEATAYAQARKKEPVARKLRLRSYNDPTIQQVLIHLLAAPSQALEPGFGASRLPEYTVKSVAGESLTVDQRILQRMADIRFVTEAMFERIIFCPVCASPSKVYARFTCAHCGSIDISMSRMIEHLNCGTIHQEEAFRVGKSMICPTCKKLLQRTDEYRLIGLVCSCRACKAHFEDPTQGYFCRNCKHNFTLPTAMVVDVFTYTLNKDTLEEARAHVGLDTLTEILATEGFEVKSPGLLAGTAKEVEFSVVLSKDGKVFAVDISQSNSEVDVEPLLQLYVKTLQTKLTKAIFGAVPRLSSRARDMATFQGIAVAEGATISEISHKIVEITKSS